MKKRVKIFLITCSSLTLVFAVIIPLLPFMLNWNPTFGMPSFEFPIEKPSEVIHLAAYNTPNWGEPGKFHDGIDLQIFNATKIISPCNGIVTMISSSINPYKGHIMIHLSIRVNFGWVVRITFEPYSNDTAFHEYQLSLIKVKPSQHISTGEELGLLLNGGEYPHIHYSIYRYLFKDICPYYVSSTTAKQIFDETALRTNSTICYP